MGSRFFVGAVISMACIKSCLFTKKITLTLLFVIFSEKLNSSNKNNKTK
jgi:hypothetical protein